MEAAPDDNTAVQQILGLLTHLPILSAVTLYHQLSAGTAHITVRKLAHQGGPRPQYHYWWETRVISGGQERDDTGTEACATAEVAYQAAVQAAERRARGAATSDDS
jgi:hypothetical protein